MNPFNPSIQFSDNCTNALCQTSLPFTRDTIQDKEKNKTNTFKPSNKFSDNCTNALPQTSLPSTTSDTIEDPSSITKQEIPSQEKLGKVVVPEFKQRKKIDQTDDLPPEQGQTQNTI